MKLITLLTFSFVFLFTACIEGDKKSPQNLQPEMDPETTTTPEVTEIEVDEVDADETDLNVDVDAGIAGEYLAVFDMVNPQVTGKVTGAFTFSRKVEKDQVVGDVRITNAGVKIIHSQHVRVGTRCPGPQDDTNGDGIIDAVEGEKVYGRAFFPLDDDLSSQASGDRFFPDGNQYGNYAYSKVAKFSDFIKDLRSTEARDQYFRLRPRQYMRLEGRVVVVNGIDPEIYLPDTVRTLPRNSKDQTLPIVCGVIKKVQASPGEIDDGTYPNP